MTTAVQTKYCRGCQLDKPVSEFGKDNTREEGRLYYRCKTCARTRGSQLRKDPAHRASHAKAQKKWFLKNLAREKAKQRARSKQYWDEHQGSIEFTIKNRFFKARNEAPRRGLEFSIQVDDLLQIYKDQDGKCAISGRVMKPIQRRPEKGRSLPDSLSLDRIDSKRGYVRGNVRLVVWAVNVALGAWGDKHLIELCGDITACQKEKNDAR